MSIVILEKKLYLVKLSMEPDEFVACLKAHRKKWATPDEYEKEGKSLCQQDFPADSTARFAAKIITWGRGDRFLDRFRKNNSDQNIASSLRCAAYLANDQNKPSEAVSHVQQLYQLGQSFASKIVRFISPERAVILDSVIRSELGYPETPDGYNAFLYDCKDILSAMYDTHPEWRICDVESAIFAKIQGYDQ